jgi:hypothetical protein
MKIDTIKLKHIIDEYVSNKAKIWKRLEFKNKHKITTQDMFYIYKNSSIGRLKYHDINRLVDISWCVVKE